MKISEDLVKSNYLYKDEQNALDMFKRVAKALSTDNAMEQRIFGYLKDHKFMFATPVLANIGTDRGLPISCYVNEVDDSREGIFSTYNEISWLSSEGGGIGTYWGNVREIGAAISNKGVSSGIIPFLKVTESLSGAVSQGGLRRASQAVYIKINHPEIDEFLSLRRENGADLNRRCIQLHHGVILDDKFMKAVIDGDEYELVSPKTGQVTNRVSARSLWFKLLTTRIETGEPYIVFEDNVNKALPKYYKDKGYKITLSNLCTEIFQHTSKDKTAVCALGSINLDKWDEVKDDDTFFKDIIIAMNNVLEEYVDKVRGKSVFSKAVASVLEERNIGIGVMGFHTLLQSRMIPFESSTAISLSNKIFKTISDKLRVISTQINDGVTPKNVMRMAIAPTSSISIICGCVSAGIEPIIANIFTHKIGTGSYVVKNPHLDAYLKDNNLEHLWDVILQNEGSVQGIDVLPQEVKDVFKTAFEIDQRYIIEAAGLRQEYICQGQSVNIFLKSDVHKQTIHDLHILAWKKGLKSLYYCRSKNPKVVGLSKSVEREIIPELPQDECVACQ